MMFLPSIFGKSSMEDDFFEDFFNAPGFVRNERLAIHPLKTDIKEHDDSYEFNIDVPGMQKDNINIELKNGYMLVSVSTEQNSDEKDENGKYIHRERYYGSSSRSFFVGKEITEEDVHAKFENGILNITIPKKENVEEKEQKKLIAIE